MKYVIALILFAIVGFILWRRRVDGETAKKAASSAAIEKPKVNKFKAVSIIPGPDSCDVANELRGKRLLSNEVGSFPLEGCDKAECSCRYAHHEDRRDEDDRRIPVRGFVETQLEEDKRNQSDRRAQTLDDE